MRRWPVEGERIDGAKLLAWARSLAGTDDVVMRVLHNKLVAYVNGDESLHGGVQGRLGRRRLRKANPARS